MLMLLTQSQFDEDGVLTEQTPQSVSWFSSFECVCLVKPYDVFLLVEYILLMFKEKPWSCFNLYYIYNPVLPKKKKKT